MGDKTPNEQRDREGQEAYVQSINQIPEDFLEDEAVPSIFLDDVEGDKEVWLLECPVTVEPSKLLGKQLHFGHQTSFKSDDISNERIIASPIREEGVVCCLLSRSSGLSTKPVGLQHAGKLRLNLSYDAPCSGSMIPDGSSVPLPEGLKTRHPFLGPRYQEIVEVMKTVEKNIVNVKRENIEEDVPRKKKKKKKSIGSNNKDDIGSEEIESVNEPVVEFMSPKKKKKHASHDEDSEDVIATYEGIKIKKEKIQASPNKYHDLNQYSCTSTDVNVRFSKMVKKEKIRNSMVQNDSDSTVGFQDEFTHDLSEFISEKRKKKKKDHRNSDSDVITEDVIEELAYKKVKKKKSEMPVILEEVPEEACYEIQEITIEDTKPAKKKRKRHTMDNADIQYVSTISDGCRNIDSEESNGFTRRGKKKKIGHIPMDEIILLSPKKEKKIKQEYPEIFQPDSPKGKRKKDKRKSCLPELL